MDERDVYVRMEVAHTNVHGFIYRFSLLVPFLSILREISPQFLEENNEFVVTLEQIFDGHPSY